MNPIPSLDSGMRFPLELPLGKHVPLYGSIPGCGFRLRRHPETTSQSERGFRDVLSTWAAIGKACPGLRCQGVFFTPAPCIEFDSPRFGACVGAGHGQLKFDEHRIHVGLIDCAENLRICFANPHRLRSAAAALARGLKTLTRFLYARALHRVRFSAGRDDVGAGALSAVIRSTSHLFRAEALHGESAYLLRKSAPASAACRRPRPLATNAPRLFNARALHKVRFSAVRTRNKKAGRYEYLPACYVWWSWRSFGRTPRHLDL